VKYIAPIASLLVAALSAFSEPIAALVAAHPNLALLFGSLGILASSLAPQPQKRAE